MTATATGILNAYVVDTYTDPDGVSWLVTSVDRYDGLKRLPQVLTLDGKTYGRSGWNSDTNRAYFRDDISVAKRA